jgi:hypothetical protein
MASRSLNDTRPQTPSEDGADEALSPFGSFSRSRGHASATRSTPNNNNRPRLPSTLSPDAEIQSADRPAKRRRTVNDLTFSTGEASNDSPLFLPDDASSPIQFDLSGPSPFAFAANRREIPTPHRRPPTQSPAPAALWNSASPRSTTTPSSGSRSGTHSQPIEIDLGDDDDDGPIVLDDDDDDVVVIDLSTNSATTGGDNALAPSPPADGPAAARWQTTPSEAAAMFGLHPPEQTSVAHQSRQGLQQQAQQRQRLELQQRQQKQAQQPAQPAQSTQQEDVAEGPPTLKRLTCVICMDVPTDLTAAACGSFTHFCSVTKV